MVTGCQGAKAKFVRIFLQCLKMQIFVKSGLSASSAKHKITRNNMSQNSFWCDGGRDHGWNLGGQPAIVLFVGIICRYHKMHTHMIGLVNFGRDLIAL